MAIFDCCREAMTKAQMGSTANTPQQAASAEPALKKKPTIAMKGLGGGDSKSMVASTEQSYVALYGCPPLKGVNAKSLIS